MTEQFGDLIRVVPLPLHEATHVIKLHSTAYIHTHTQMSACKYEYILWTVQMPISSF